MNSIARITQPHCSTLKSKAIDIAASAIRQIPCLKSASPQLEGGVGALSVATGQAALFYAFANVADHGGNIVGGAALSMAPRIRCCSMSFPGKEFGVRFAQSDSPEDMAAAIDENTRAMFCESVGNPAGNVCDIAALAEVAHARGVPLIVDNTVATPILLRPIEHGADIVVHSLTKFMGGHGTTLGGAIVDGGRFRWSDYPARFPMFNEPDASYHGMVYADHFGETAYIARARSVYQRTTGAVLAPLSAFLLLQGLETVALRVERHVENARKVAEFLRDGSPRRLGELCRAFLTVQTMPWPRNILAAVRPHC